MAKFKSTQKMEKGRFFTMLTKNLVSAIILLIIVKSLKKELKMEVQNLKSYLANVGMSIREFSEKVDCTQKYMSQLSLGKFLPSKRLAKDIYEATGGVVRLKTKSDYANNCQAANDNNNHGG